MPKKTYIFRDTKIIISSSTQSEFAWEPTEKIHILKTLLKRPYELQ